MKISALPILLATAALATAFSEAATIPFDIQGTAGFGLLTGNEVPAVIGTGTGGEIGAGIFLDDQTNILTVNVGWGSLNGFTDLSSPVNNSHIHGTATNPAPASFTQGGLGALFNLPRVSSTANSGSISTSVALSALQVVDLQAGKYYINIHTTTNGGGELRGNIVATPEPSTCALAVVGALGFLARRQRRAA